MHLSDDYIFYGIVVVAFVLYFVYNVYKNKNRPYPKKSISVVCSGDPVLSWALSVLKKAQKENHADIYFCGEIAAQTYGNSERSLCNAYFDIIVDVGPLSMLNRDSNSTKLIDKFMDIAKTDIHEKKDWKLMRRKNTVYLCRGRDIYYPIIIARSAGTREIDVDINAPTDFLYNVKANWNISTDKDVVATPQYIEKMRQMFGILEPVAKDGENVQE